MNNLIATHEAHKLLALQVLDLNCELGSAVINTMPSVSASRLPPHNGEVITRNVDAVSAGAIADEASCCTCKLSTHSCFSEAGKSPDGKGPQTTTSVSPLMEVFDHELPPVVTTARAVLASLPIGKSESRVAVRRSSGCQLAVRRTNQDLVEKSCHETFPKHNGRTI